ncbi:hypothetical protein AVEN_56418-1 [Araneus ventricosus]|uniref:Uncharacterized protein n=1 Tax=Araneus ventricosus TaxID=182803 RepID=A0A4Y2JUF4_ARAVE|nr:hypothetical protein AVEN_56418-1 [Araneus ventricosus]
MRYRSTDLEAGPSAKTPLWEVTLVVFPMPRRVFGNCIKINASSACGEENRRIACSLNSLRMRRDCFQYASKTRRPKCLLPYKISPPELVFAKLPSFRSIPSLHRHLRMRMELNKCRPTDSQPVDGFGP